MLFNVSMVFDDILLFGTFFCSEFLITPMRQWYFWLQTSSVPKSGTKTGVLVRLAWDSRRVTATICSITLLISRVTMYFIIQTGAPFERERGVIVITPDNRQKLGSWSLSIRNMTYLPFFLLCPNLTGLSHTQHPPQFQSVTFHRCTSDGPLFKPIFLEIVF